MLRFRRLSVLVLGLVLASSLAVAAPRDTGFPAGKLPAASTSAETVLERLWSWLTAVWTKEGCIIDPNGGCTKGPDSSPATASHGDEGCGIDPNGLEDAGCILDPNGGS